MAITYNKLDSKIKRGEYASLNRALRAVKVATNLSKEEKKTLSQLATVIYSELPTATAEEPTRELQKPVNVDESILSKLDGGRSLSAKADPTRILAFDERLTELAFHFLSVAVDFKLNKEELGRKLAAKLKTV